MAPLWEPGTASMYHFVTFGVLAGELIRRVDGRTPGRFIADEIVRPLEIDLWLGLPPDQEARRAPHFRTGNELSADQWRAIMSRRRRRPGRPPDPRVPGDGGLGGRRDRTAEHLPRRRAAELPAGGAIGDARALAQIYAALIGRVDGVRLISEEAMERARAPRPAASDRRASSAKLARGERSRSASASSCRRR